MLSAWDLALEICHYDAEWTNTSAREVENVRKLETFKTCLPCPWCIIGDIRGGFSQLSALTLRMPLLEIRN
jgi:hypothetical protein